MCMYGMGMGQECAAWGSGDWGIACYIHSVQTPYNTCTVLVPSGRSEWCVVLLLQKHTHTSHTESPEYLSHVEDVKLSLGLAAHIVGLSV